MRRIKLGRPSPALAVSLVALFVALSGTAVALQAGSVGPKQLKRKAVRTKHVKRNAVRSKHVKDGALTGADVDEATLDLPAGPPGPEGEQGEIGPSDAFSGSLDGELELVESPDSLAVALAAVPAGDYAIGAKLVVNAPAENVVDCELIVREPGGDAVPVDSSSAEFGASHALDTIALQAAHGSDGARLHQVVCSKREPTSAVVSNARITAIRLGSVTEQAQPPP